MKRTSRPELARMLRRGRRSRRWSPGPYSHLRRLAVAAWDGHDCFALRVQQPLCRAPNRGGVLRLDGECMREAGHVIGRHQDQYGRQFGKHGEP